MSSHHHPEHVHHADDLGVPDGLAELLDLDAEVLAEPLHQVLTDIERLLDAPLASILDLGAGTGAGTFALLRHFTGAHATAVDASADLLAHLDRRAEHLGLAHRVTTVRADLDHALPVVEPVDLAWASAALHHLADPDRTLAQVASAIRPGGLLAVVELSGFPRFLPDGTTAGATEARAHALLAADRAVDMPAMGSEWGARLTRAGLVIEQDRGIVVDLEPPLPPAAGAYAAACLLRIQNAVAERLHPADRAELDALLDGGPSDVRRRADLRVAAHRSLWIARRP